MCLSAAAKDEIAEYAIQHGEQVKRLIIIAIILSAWHISGINQGRKVFMM